MIDAGAGLHLADLVHAEELKAPPHAGAAAARAAAALSGARRRRCSRSSGAAARSARRCRPPDRRHRSRCRPHRRRFRADLAAAARRRRAAGADPGLRPRGGALPRGALARARQGRHDRPSPICGRRWSSCSRTRSPQPQEAELRAYFQAHAEKFRTEPLISFRQVFVSVSRGAPRKSDARQILARLVSAGPEAADGGDPLLLGEAFDLTPLDRIAALFGDDFAAGWRRPRRGAGSVRCNRPTACTWSW